MNLPLNIGSRASALALVQVDEVLIDLKDKGHAIDAQVIKYSTRGDKDKTTSLLANPGDDFFTDTLDQALLKGEIDIAVHSAKDLPQKLHPELAILALTKPTTDRDAWVGHCHWQDLPQGGKVGTSSALRKSEVLGMRPDVQIVDIRGTIGERIELVKKGVVDGIIVAECAMNRLGLAHEVKDTFPWEGMALQGQLAIVGRKHDHKLRQVFESIDVRLTYGKVLLVGAGPGDPELITVKGIKALEQADCVFYDYLADEHLLKHAPQAEHISVGKRKGEHSMPQEELSRLLKVKALSGKGVVRLKGGDPLIFGRGADEINYLRSYHIKVEIIPGVSSATGIPSHLGLPLTARGVSSSVAFISAHEEAESRTDPRPIAVPNTDTIVFLMGITKLHILVESLRKAGRADDTPVMIISKGTRPDEQIVQGTISTIEGLVTNAKIKPPALIIVGKTIDLYRPQEKLTFLHCGTHPEIYSYLGRIIHFPMIEIKPAPLSASEQKNLWDEFEASDIILCTSRYAVENFIKILLSMKSIVDFSHKTFAVIGPHTAETLHSFGVKPQIIGQQGTAEGLFKALVSAMDLKGKRILFPRSSLPNPFLKDALTAQGAKVTEITIYVNTKPAKRDLPDVSIDGVIFTSPSTVKNFLADYGTIPTHWQIIAKGPVTAQELENNHYNHYKTSI